MNASVVVLAAVCVLAAAALIAARQPTRQPEVTIADAQPERTVAPARATVKKKTVASKPSAAAAPTGARLADATKGKTGSGESAKVPAVKSPAKTAGAESKAAVDTKGTSETMTAPSVTITGCLDRDNDTFWLKDTSGADAPKSRSWKSGFLRKRSSRIELVDAGNGLRLPNYVGQRVTATGVLVDRQMRARSLQRAGACN